MSLSIDRAGTLHRIRRTEEIENKRTEEIENKMTEFMTKQPKK